MPGIKMEQNIAVLLPAAAIVPSCYIDTEPFAVLGSVKFDGQGIIPRSVFSQLRVIGIMKVEQLQFEMTVGEGFGMRRRRPGLLHGVAVDVIIVTSRKEDGAVGGCG